MNQPLDQFKKLTITARLSLFVAALLLVTIGITVNNALTRQEKRTRAASNLPTASTSRIVINPDKTISIDGRPTFLIGVMAICAEGYIDENGTPLNCAENVAINSNSLLDMSPSANGESDYYTLINKNNAYGNIMFTGMGWRGRKPEFEALNSFFGYYQPDEPTIDHNTGTYYQDWTQEAMEEHLLNSYNTLGYAVTGHPVIIGIWGYGGSGFGLWGAQKYADIVSWDNYPFSFHGWEYWTREDSIYAWEQMSNQNLGLNGIDFETFSKPIWTTLQAYGAEDTTPVRVLNKQEVRVMTWAAITTGVQGIQYYAYLTEGDWWHATTSGGLWRNQALAAVYNNLIGEVTSLNDILVLPATDHQWLNHAGTTVTFNNKIDKWISYFHSLTNWNYMRKDSGGVTYLIVVNKDASPISNIEMTVSGLSGSMTAKTLGKETTGSSRAGKTLAVTSGKFTDSFDGYAVHIYQIYSSSNSPASTPTPIPTSTPTPAATLLNLTIYQHGIGNSGDNTNPTNTSLSNKNPVHPTINGNLELFNTNNQLIGQGNGQLTYANTAGNYQGIIGISPNTIPSGNYYLKVKTPGHLKRLIPDILTITAGQTNTVPAATLVTGDANNDNRLDILDYNLLLGCYSDLAPAISCDANKKTATDFNDDSFVNQVDYNLFLREIATQPGQ